MQIEMLGEMVCIEALGAIFEKHRGIVDQKADRSKFGRRHPHQFGSFFGVAQIGFQGDRPASFGAQSRCKSLCFGKRSVAMDCYGKIVARQVFRYGRAKSLCGTGHQSCPRYACFHCDPTRLPVMLLRIYVVRQRVEQG